LFANSPPYGSPPSCELLLHIHINLSNAAAVRPCGAGGFWSLVAFLTDFPREPNLSPVCACLEDSRRTHTPLHLALPSRGEVPGLRACPHTAPLGVPPAALTLMPWGGALGSAASATAWCGWRCGGVAHVDLTAWTRRRPCCRRRTAPARSPRWRARTTNKWTPRWPSHASRHAPAHSAAMLSCSHSPPYHTWLPGEPSRASGSSFQRAQVPPALVNLR
jgi:hypothetical protein